MRKTSHLLPALILLLTTPGLWAGDDEHKPKEPAPIPEPQVFTSEHEGTFNGVRVAYTTIAGETYLRDEDGEPMASIFTFSYLKKDVADKSTRPVAFVWNGGPGSPSVWLHMGTLGPRRVEVPSDAKDDGAPPYPLEDNPLTVLDVTDLVFVDPVGTGFSRPLGEHEGREFWGLNEDAESIAELIRLWVRQHGRWNSPKFLIGESFGTTRAAAVTSVLEGGSQNISLNGLVMISQALDYTGSTPVHDNFISFVTFLPTMAAAAWYHGKVEPRPEELETFLEEARTFAVDDYAPALLKGNRLGDEEKKAVAARLAYFIGLDAAYVERADLRVLVSRFLKERRRDEGLALGRLDGRYLGDDIDDTSDSPEGDPASYGIGGAYLAALHQYMAADLGVDIERKYETDNNDLGRHWKWRTAPPDTFWEPSYVNVARRLSQAMRRNSDLKVLVASGYYDLVTPFFDAEYTLTRHGILAERVTFTYYPAGHMMYLHGPSHGTLLGDIRAFLLETLKEDS